MISEWFRPSHIQSFYSHLPFHFIPFRCDCHFFLIALFIRFFLLQFYLCLKISWIISYFVFILWLQSLLDLIFFHSFLSFEFKTLNRLVGLFLLFVPIFENLRNNFLPANRVNAKVSHIIDRIRILIYFVTQIIGMFNHFKFFGLLEIRNYS